MQNSRLPGTRYWIHEDIPETAEVHAAEIVRLSKTYTVMIFTRFGDAAAAAKAEAVALLLVSMGLPRPNHEYD